VTSSSVTPHTGSDEWRSTELDDNADNDDDNDDDEVGNGQRISADASTPPSQTSIYDGSLGGSDGANTIFGSDPLSVDPDDTDVDVPSVSLLVRSRSTRGGSGDDSVKNTGTIGSRTGNSIRERPVGRRQDPDDPGKKRLKRRKWPQYVGYGSGGVTADGGSSSGGGEDNSFVGDVQEKHLPMDGESRHSTQSGQLSSASPQMSWRRNQWEGNGLVPSSGNSINSVIDVEDHQLHTEKTERDAGAEEPTYRGQDGRAKTDDQETVDRSDSVRSSWKAVGDWNRLCHELKCPIGIDCVPDTLREDRPRCRCPLGSTGKRCQRG